MAVASQQYEQHHTDAGSEKHPESLANNKDEEDVVSERDAPETEARDVAEKHNNAPENPGPPPNGGTQAWIQVLCSFFLFFNTWGILNTFGVYQTYYESGALYSETSSNISWIGSIQSFCVLLVGAFVGPIYDRGHLRALLIVGTFFMVVGHMMLSLCTEFWQCILAQGFMIGIGGGCLYVPSVAILPTYFTTKIGLAIGLGAAGSSMGGIIYPIMFYRLIDQVGFGWSVRILGFTALATLLIPVSLMKMRVKPGKVRSIIDWSALTDVPFVVFVLGTVIGFIGLYVGIFYLSYYGEANGYTDTSLSFYLVPILNAGSVFGRTLPNILSDKIGPLNVIAPGAICVGIVLFCALAAQNAGGLIVVVLLFGFFSGIFIALPPVVFVALTKDKSKVGTRIGMGFAFIGLGVLAGGPGGGAILGKDNWTGTWIYAGVMPITAGCIFGAIRLFKTGGKLMVRV